jgi:hypothetical protein
MAPVPAAPGTSPRDRRTGSGRAQLAALAIFAAGLTSAFTFREGPKPAAHQPVILESSAAPSPAAPAFPAPIRAPEREPDRSSPLPFYGEGGQVAAAPADSPAQEEAVSEARPAEPREAAPDELVSFVPVLPRQRVEAPQPKPFNPPRLHARPFFVQVASAKGMSAGGLRLSGVENARFVRTAAADTGRVSASYGGAPCPSCNIQTPDSREDQAAPLARTRRGVVHLKSRCADGYIYEVINQSNQPLHGPLQLGGTETWDVNLPGRGVTWIKSRQLMGEPDSYIGIGPSGA